MNIMQTIVVNTRTSNEYYKVVLITTLPKFTDIMYTLISMMYQQELDKWVLRLENRHQET